jgi:pimeloyl-ACP methyl ester carboxylesterase
MMRHTPPPAFKRGVATEVLELRGVRTRALQFAGGVQDPTNALVCVAGMGANGRSFARQRSLAADRLVLMLNTPFETPADVDPLRFTMDCVEEYLDHERLVRPVLCGSSFGGAVAAGIALRNPGRLGGLILAGAVLSRRQILFASKRFVDLLEAPEPIARLVAPLAAQVMGGFRLDRDARDEIVREARHFTGEELKRRLETLLHLDLLEDLPRIKIPTLVIHGTRDWLIPWRRAVAAQKRIPGAELALIRHAGHLPYLSHARTFNTAVRSFLARRLHDRAGT